MSAENETEREDDELVPDPCEPVVVPGGPGCSVSCGRMRAPDGTHVLDTGGNSG